MIIKRILIADDNSRIRRVLRSFLESRTRFKVCGEAVNGLDVIEKAINLNPDLIVMDFSMPVMNGIEVGAILNRLLPGIPVILYTSHDSALIETHAVRVGVRAVIPKQDMAGLARHLQTLLFPNKKTSLIRGCDYYEP